MISEKNLLQDIARALGCSVDELPANLTDKQLQKSIGLAPGTIEVKRCRGGFPIPSYKVGRSRRKPLSAVIKFKLDQIQDQLEGMEAA